MPLIEEIEKELPLVSVLREEWQKEIALTLSKYLVACDDSLTKSSDELKDLREQELEAFRRRFGLELE